MKSGKPSLAPEPVSNDALHVAACAERLLGAPISDARPVTGGGNNRVYRIASPSGLYALKFYPRQEADPRDRLGQEFAALGFLAANGVACVPAPVACDRGTHCALYEWVAGDAPGAARDEDIDAMTRLARTLAELASTDAARALCDASASCFSPDETFRQFNTRVSRLMDSIDDPDLQAFLQNDLHPAMQFVEARARKLCGDAGTGFEDILDQNARTLSPSDFGLHNARRQADGSLRFLDFEYFGWDDPVKMIADAYWHPGSKLPDDLAGKLRRDMSDIFNVQDGARFQLRFDALFPAYGAIWCLIILNEFLPERWSRRIAAGTTESPEAARARQLQRARVHLQKVIDSSHD